jgi:hypothetical protein
MPVRAPDCQGLAPRNFPQPSDVEDAGGALEDAGAAVSAFDSAAGFVAESAGSALAAPPPLERA